MVISNPLKLCNLAAQMSSSDQQLSSAAHVGHISWQLSSATLIQLTTEHFSSALAFRLKVFSEKFESIFSLVIIIFLLFDTLEQKLINLSGMSLTVLDTNSSRVKID